MKQILTSLTFACTMMAAACGGSPKVATPKGPTCAAAADNLAAQMIATGEKSGMDMASFAAMSRDVVNERCPADGWSADAIACLATATSEQMEACSKKLTPEQNHALEEAVKAKMESMEPVLGAPAESAPPSDGADPCGGDE